MSSGNRISVLACCLVCSAAGALSGEDARRSRNFIFTLQGNSYHGSIVGRNRVDGLTGATKSTGGGTIGVEYNLNGRHLQAMATFGRTKQTIHYVPAPTDGAGDREIKLYLLDFPFMYNFHLLPKERFGHTYPRLTFGAGAFISFVLHQEIVDTDLESADVSPWALGPFLRAAYYPWPFRWLQPGIFLEFYRSFVPKVYDDPFFNENGIAGQLGIMNMGITLRL